MSSHLADCIKASSRTQKSVAAKLGVDRITLYRWGRKGVPAERVLEVERITGVSRHDLRPDIYPRERKRRA